ncbi:MAG: CoA-transferase [Eubacteriales bacterium]|nr:CoA-transferase [Eubacteriales bacterium]
MNKAEKGIRICDMMVCAMSRQIKDGDKVFHGVSSHMPMIAFLLARATHAPNAVYLNIPGGMDAIPKKPVKYSSAGAELLERSTAYFPLAEIFDLSMRGQLDIAFLSGIQFDKGGHVNASVIGDYHKPKVRMPGGAGSAVLIPTVKRAIIWRTKHDTRTFVDKVDFITTKGNLSKVITPLCVFEYIDGQLEPEAIYPYTTLEEVKERTGFSISKAAVRQIEPPTKEELNYLQRLDPENYRAIEFQ